MNVIVKLTFPDGSTRRATVSRDAGIKDLKAKARALLGETDPASDAPADVSVQYQDSDGDWIWVVTDAELAEYMAASEAANKVPKFTVKPAAKPATNANADSDEPEAQAQEEPPREPTPEPEDPMIVLARALANPTTVQLLQAQLASSPVVTDAVVSVANGFVEGGPLRAAEAAMEALPNVKAAAMDAVKQDADLHDAVQGAIDHVESGAAHMPFAPWAAFMHGPFRGGGWHGRGGGGCHGRGGGGWHGGRGGWHGGWHGGHGHGHGCGPHQAQAQAHAQAQPQGPGVHPFVFCDACSASEELKAKSKLAGNISFRGWIAGPRFRSKTIHDFDLCESCHKTSQFAETHGPFERIEPRVAGFCEGGAGAGAGAGPGAHPWAGRGGPWGGRGRGWGGCRPGGPRGCRGSGRRGFADVVAETLGRCAEAVNEVADESSELAQIARAIQESLKTQTQAPGVGIDKVVQPGRAEAKAEAAAKPEAKAEAAAKPEAKAEAAKPEAKAEAAKPAPEATPEAKPASPKHSSRSSDDSDEWVVEEDPMVKWRDALQRLHALGFTDSHEYLAMLEEEKGDLERVINRIIRRNA